MDLFDNPMINAAKQALTPEQQEEYKKIGEQMYGDMDFETCKVLNNLPQPMVNAVEYLDECIHSGMHISYLEKNDQALMEQAFGKYWYERYGYIEADKKNMITFP